MGNCESLVSGANGSSCGRPLADPEAFQRSKTADQFSRMLVTIVGLLGDHLLKDQIEPHWHIGPLVAERRHRRLHVCQDFFHGGVFLVHACAGQQAKQRAAEAIDVAAGVGLAGVGGLLGRHVIDGAHHDAGVGQLLIGHLAIVKAGQPHVEDFDDALFVEQQVGGLDVAMHDAGGVCTGQAAGGLQDVADGFGNRQGAIGLDEGREILPFDILHDEIPDAALHAGVVGLHDIGVREPGGGFDFAAEPFDRGLVLGEGRREQLDRDQALHVPVLGLVNLPHAASADFRQEHIVANYQRRVRTGQ